MKACIQRVTSARVVVAEQIVGEIQRGLLVLLGVAVDDTTRELTYMVEKTAGLRVFDDAAGKMNLSVSDVEGAVLVVSQFTLLADCRKGKRPSFVGAAPPALAESLYAAYIQGLRARQICVAAGRFGAHMQVELVNDGPVTIWLESPP